MRKEGKKMKNKPENMIAGLVGAFLGSLLGVACIVGIGQLGYVAALSGLIMAVCALKGYELLGGVLSRKGAALVCVLILVMTYVGNQLDFAVTVAVAADVNVFLAFQGIYDLLDAGYVNGAAYWGNLVMLYLFTLLGAVPTLIAAFRRGNPVSAPPEEHGAPAPSVDGPVAQFYPFAGLSWTRALRLSLSLPLLLGLLIGLATAAFWESGPLLSFSLAIAGWLVGAMAAMVVMLVLLAPCQNFQMMFVRSNGGLWRVDLGRLSLMEPYRFTTRVGWPRALRWEKLTEEEQQRAKASIERAIRAICTGEVLPGGLLQQIVLYLPDPRLEKEDKWTWKITYAIGEDGIRRKSMRIGKVYPGLVPAPGTNPPEGPVPARWRFLPLVLVLCLGLAVIGGGIGSAIEAGAGRPNRESPAVSQEVRPESIVFYEQNGGKFQIDSTFLQDDQGVFTDPDTGTTYILSVSWGADAETALDILLAPIGIYRNEPAFQEFSFAYADQEEDLVELEAEDGTVYRHNLLTIRFTDGTAVHNAVSLADSGGLIQVVAAHGDGIEEDEVIGTMRFILTHVGLTPPPEGLEPSAALQ